MFMGRLTGQIRLQLKRMGDWQIANIEFMQYQGKSTIACL